MFYELRLEKPILKLKGLSLLVEPQKIAENQIPLPILSQVLCAHDLDSVHVLLDFVDAVIEMVITIIENLHNPALVLRSRLIVIFAKSLGMEALVTFRRLLLMILLKKGL